jgi:hypothetical protein
MLSSRILALMINSHLPRNGIIHGNVVYAGMLRVLA